VFSVAVHALTDRYSTSHVLHLACVPALAPWHGVSW
jgi:hypothetical protein